MEPARDTPVALSVRTTAVAPRGIAPPVIVVATASPGGTAPGASPTPRRVSRTRAGATSRNCSTVDGATWPTAVMRIPTRPPDRLTTLNRLSTVRGATTVRVCVTPGRKATRTGVPPERRGAMRAAPGFRADDMVTVRSMGTSTADCATGREVAALPRALSRTALDLLPSTACGVPETSVEPEAAALAVAREAGTGSPRTSRPAASPPTTVARTAVTVARMRTIVVNPMSVRRPGAGAIGRTGRFDESAHGTSGDASTLRVPRSAPSGRLRRAAASPPGTPCSR
jgi:hypothetical protein